MRLAKRWSKTCLCETGQNPDAASDIQDTHKLYIRTLLVRGQDSTNTQVCTIFELQEVVSSNNGS